MSEKLPFALVLMPFDSRFDDVYRIGIQETATKMGFRAERLDDQIFSEGMMERLYQQIDEADLIIADMSTKSANVFYEVGYADAREKLCILITATASDIPFDLKHRRHIVYGESLGQLRQKLQEDLAWAAEQIRSGPGSAIRADCRCLRARVDAKAYSIGSAEFAVDLFNESARHAAEVHATYLYVVDESWRFAQSGHKCGSIASDVEPFTARHLLSCPVSRIPRDGWVQLQFSGTVVLASWGGGPPPPWLPIREPALLRLVTDKGNIDIDLEMDAQFSTRTLRSG